MKALAVRLFRLFYQQPLCQQAGEIKVLAALRFSGFQCCGPSGRLPFDVAVWKRRDKTATMFALIVVLISATFFGQGAIRFKQQIHLFQVMIKFGKQQCQLTCTLGSGGLGK